MLKDYDLIGWLEDEKAGEENLKKYYEEEDEPQLEIKSEGYIEALEMVMEQLKYLENWDKVHDATEMEPIRVKSLVVQSRDIISAKIRKIVGKNKKIKDVTDPYVKGKITGMYESLYIMDRLLEKESK